MWPNLLVYLTFITYSPLLFGNSTKWASPCFLGALLGHKGEG